MNTNIQIPNMDTLVDNMLNSVVITDGVMSDSTDVTSIIQDPFYDNPDSDLLSVIYRNFHENTDVPLGIPVFSMLSFISAWLLKNNSRILLPKQSEPSFPHLWLLVLADSGASKTRSYNAISSMIPTDEHGTKVIEQNLFKPNGPVGFFDQLEADSDKRGYLFLDEAADLFDSMNQAQSPLTDMRDFLLKLKDGDLIARITAKRNSKINGYLMTTLFINTIDIMADVINDKAMVSGLFRRFTPVIANKDRSPDRHMTDRIMYGELRNERTKQKIEEFFSQNVTDQVHVFHPQCLEMYEKCFKLFWFKSYASWMVDNSDDSYYRTYWMESWKYALIHHKLKHRSSLEIQPDSMQWAIRVVLILLNSLKSFIQTRALRAALAPKKFTDSQRVSVPVLEKRLSKIYQYILDNENHAEFCLRNITRKFAITNDELHKSLQSIKANIPDFTTKLIPALEKSFSSKRKPANKKPTQIPLI